MSGLVPRWTTDKWSRDQRSEWSVYWIETSASIADLVVMACQTVSNILKSSLGPVG